MDTKVRDKKTGQLAGAGDAGHRRQCGHTAPPLRAGHLPTWLRRQIQAHVAAMPDAAPVTNAAEALDALRAIVDVRFPLVSWCDHHGTSAVGRRVFWIVEPYTAINDLADVMRFMADLLGCDWHVTPRTAHGHATVRGILFEREGKDGDQ